MELEFIYRVMAKFDDGESTNWLLIGNFTYKSVANLYKSKWENFFSSDNYKSILNEPENWKSECDEWTKEDGGSWEDSKAYYTLEDKYRHFNEFIEIIITELPLNQEVFIDNNFGEDMSNLMKQYNRDWNLEKIL